MHLGRLYGVHMRALGLIPFETLPGWPTAPAPSVLDYMIVLYAIPFGIGLVFTVLGFAGKLIQRGKTA